MTDRADSFILPDMVLQIFRRVKENLHRRVQRAFISDAENLPKRYAIIMTSILFVSIVITYNVLYEKEKREKGIQPPSVTDLFRERNAKIRRERLELQRSILQAKSERERTTENDL